MPKDLFSSQAMAYARFRPTYPPALYAFLLSRVSTRQYAWDCATGNGQVAQHLASSFTHVAATDLSAQQIAQAPPLPNVTYQVSPAENTPFPDHQFDLITVGQALHWFDVDAFYREVRRVARARAQLAVWTYGLLKIDEEVDRLVWQFYREVLGDYWDAERRHVDAGYATLPFPFAEVEERLFTQEVSWTLHHLAGYFSSWSAVRRYQERHGTDPIPTMLTKIKAVWPESQPKLVRFPLVLKMGTVL